MQYATYSFTCELTGETRLPPYKGLVFYNRFGSHLKQTACFHKEGRCDTCRQASQCNYTRFFEMPRRIRPRQTTTAPPRPFIIVPPLTVESSFSAGAAFNFELALLGDAQEAAGCFIRAIEVMGESGIGRPRVPFAIKKIESNGQAINTHGTTSPDNLTIPELPVAASRESAVQVTFETPLRLKPGKLPEPDLPFHRLVRLALQRVSSMFECYGNSIPDLHYKEIIESARSVETTASELEWVDWKNQKFQGAKSLLIGSIIGSVNYAGPLDHLLSLLQLCEKLHLGRQSAFGLGKFFCQESE